MSMLKLEMNASQRDRGRLIAVVLGDLDHDDVVELCTRACGLIDVGSDELVLDLSAAQHYDVAENQALAWLEERMRRRGVRLTIRPGNSAVAESSGAPGYRPETAEQP